jgi:hypothetical protein
MEALFNFRKEHVSPTCFILFLTPIYEGRNSLSHNGDIWIPNATIIESHKICFFVPRLKELFTLGDKIIKVEHMRCFSKMMNRKVGYDHYKELQWNYEVFEMVTFALIPMDFGDVFEGGKN